MERIRCIHFGEEPPASEKEPGNCDRCDEEYIQPEVVESSLEPYIILAKLTFDIAFSRQT
jgi:hypothetical protein